MPPFCIYIYTRSDYIARRLKLISLVSSRKLNIIYYCNLEKKKQKQNTFVFFLVAFRISVSLSPPTLQGDFFHHEPRRVPRNINSFPYGLSETSRPIGSISITAMQFQRICRTRQRRRRVTRFRRTAAPTNPFVRAHSFERKICGKFEFEQTIVHAQSRCT